jgi:hypothetical protein
MAVCLIAAANVGVAPALLGVGPVATAVACTRGVGGWVKTAAGTVSKAGCCRLVAGRQLAINSRARIEYNRGRFMKVV